MKSGAGRGHAGGASWLGKAAEVGAGGFARAYILLCISKTCKPACTRPRMDLWICWHSGNAVEIAHPRAAARLEQI
jgi:hypothetical protein